MSNTFSFSTSHSSGVQHRPQSRLKELAQKRCHVQNVSLRTYAAPNPAVRLLDDGDTKSFLNWTREAGITCTNLAPSTFSGLRGLAATSGIKVIGWEGEKQYDIHVMTAKGDINILREP
jgi:hypothetical protein